MTAHAPRRHSIRFAAAAVVCLLLGAPTTLGVAWWCGRPTRAERGGPPVKTLRGAVREATAPTERIVCFDSACAGAAWEFDTVVVNSTEMWNESIVASGWPMHAMRSVERTAPNSPQAVRPPAWRYVSLDAGITAPPQWQGWYHTNLPLRVLWPGFAIDTALYAAAWYLLIFTPLPLYRAGRRRLRISRGMCPACAYDLEGAPCGACPECGRSPGKS